MSIASSKDNPGEVKESATCFTTLMAGLRKQGEGLAGDEKLVESPAISPRFVRRVQEENGEAA